jgi:regulatory GntR family protein
MDGLSVIGWPPLGSDLIMAATSLNQLVSTCLSPLPAGYRAFMVNPRSRKPPFEQVADILAAKIQSGELPKDERIPSEAELMAEFEIGRTTARKAVAVLRQRGLVETQRGRGTYVL